MINKNNIYKVVISLLTTAALSYYCGFSYSGIFPIFILIFILFFYQKNSLKLCKSTIIFSAIITLLLLLGKFSVFYNEDGLSYLLFIKLSICLLGIFIMFLYLISYIFDIFDKKKIINEEFNIKKLILIYIISFFSILLLWTPIWLAEYPGPITLDTFAGFMQIFKEIPYNNDNPFLHTLYIKLLFNLSSFFSSQINTRLFIMSFIQMIIHSLVYGYICTYIYKKTRRISVLILSILFYSIVSYNSIFNISISKDSTFAISMSLLIVSILEYSDKQNVINTIKIIISSILFCLLRKNGLVGYGFALFTLLFCIRKSFNKLFFLGLISLMISLIIQLSLYPVVFKAINDESLTYISRDTTIERNINNKHNDVNNNGFFLDLLDNIIPYFPSEIPTQQVFGIVAKNRELNEYEKWLIEAQCPISIIKSEYDTFVVDPIFKAIRENASSEIYSIPKYHYLKLWINLFLKYPTDYIEIYNNMTKYYYYPGRYVVTNYYGVANNNIGIIKRSIISNEYTNTIEYYLEHQYNFPLIWWLFSPGSVIILVFAALFYGAYKKNIYLIFLLSCMIGLWLTLMLVSPCGDSFRYMYPIVNCLPLIILSPFIVKIVK